MARSTHRSARRRACLAAAVLCLLVAAPLLGLSADWRAACASECCPLEGPSCCCKRPVWRGADGAPYRPPAISRSFESGGASGCRGTGAVLVSSLDVAAAQRVVRRGRWPGRVDDALRRVAEPSAVELPVQLRPRPPPA